MSESPSDEKRNLREFIEAFIGERLKPKLEDIEKQMQKAVSPEAIQEIQNKADKLREDYSMEKWLASAAKRAAQIKVATHIPKFTHSSSKASPVFSSGAKDTVYIGTHTVREIQPDVTGNAAALDVFSFLRSRWRAKTVLQMMEERSADIVSALSNNADEANDWIDGFLSVKEITSPSSHTLMKQLFFPLSDGSYHLLSPVFPSSLVHYVYNHIKEARFSEETKAAKDAKKKGLVAEKGYSDFPDITLMAYGGTKPQNVSQLNSARGGSNILLPSYPPKWEPKNVRPIYDSSVFTYAFSRRIYVKELLPKLSGVLRTYKKDADIRSKRAEIVDALSIELWNIPAELSGLPAGWSKDAKCKLSKAEKLWLDPPKKNEELWEAYTDGQWCTEVAHLFASWLNKQIAYIHKGEKMLDEKEHMEWQKIALDVLKDLLEERIYA